ncbi:putative quinol monooxygenase [Agromyces sp. NPDC058126]|uniref:putative quinol monooxygenase n=1 Tax=Agromyces sp. NPDC058126 TaxID=3346350 RepID=UPI0036DEB9A3
MTFANVGRLGVQPGARDQVIEILTRPGAELGQHGCLLYEVGFNDEQPDFVYVSELWESAEAHQASLELPEVRASIAEVMPLLSGDHDGHRFQVVGSPLRG